MDNNEEYQKVKKMFNRNDVYRNNKTKNLYHVERVARHSETGEIQVNYADKNDDGWNRPWELFLEKFTVVNKAIDTERGMW